MGKTYQTAPGDWKQTDSSQVWSVGYSHREFCRILPVVCDREHFLLSLKYYIASCAYCFRQYNWLSESLPPPETVTTKLLRQAFIGFAASVVSDTISNSLRVLKTYRQVNQAKIGYRQSDVLGTVISSDLSYTGDAAKNILEKEGWKGLLGRGLKTRILANGLQGIIFSVLWKVEPLSLCQSNGNVDNSTRSQLFQDLIEKKHV